MKEEENDILQTCEDLEETPRIRQVLSGSPAVQSDVTLSSSRRFLGVLSTVTSDPKVPTAGSLTG